MFPCRKIERGRTCILVPGSDQDSSRVTSLSLTHLCEDPVCKHRHTGNQGLSYDCIWIWSRLSPVAVIRSAADASILVLLRMSDLSAVAAHLHFPMTKWLTKSNFRKGGLFWFTVQRGTVCTAKKAWRLEWLNPCADHNVEKGAGETHLTFSSLAFSLVRHPSPWEASTHSWGGGWHFLPLLNLSGSKWPQKYT